MNYSHSPILQRIDALEDRIAKLERLARPDPRDDGYAGARPPSGGLCRENLRGLPPMPVRDHTGAPLPPEPVATAVARIVNLGPRPCPRHERPEPACPDCRFSDEADGLLPPEQRQQVEEWRQDH